MPLQKRRAIVAVIVVIIVTGVVGFLYFVQSGQDSKRLIGTIDITGIDNRFFKIYQEDEFDSSTGLYCQVVNQSDSALVPVVLFSGSHDRNSIRDFSTGSYDGIAYLTFLNPHEIVVIFNSSTNRIYGLNIPAIELDEQRQLLTRLQEHDSELILLY